MNLAPPKATPELCLRLKSEAKTIVQAEQIKHSAALARLAKREGFESWERLLHLAGGRDAVDAAKPRTPEQDAAAARRAERHRRYGSGP